MKSRQTSTYASALDIEKEHSKEEKHDTTSLKRRKIIDILTVRLIVLLCADTQLSSHEVHQIPS